MRVPRFLNSGDRDKENQMNLNAKDKTQPDSHEMESGRIKDDAVSKTETRGETRRSAGEVESEIGANSPEH